nr:hypothetical protein [Candidatus Freyrarchaeum guaymaensis]
MGSVAAARGASASRRVVARVVGTEGCLCGFWLIRVCVWYPPETSKATSPPKNKRFTVNVALPSRLKHVKQAAQLVDMISILRSCL